MKEPEIKEITEIIENKEYKIASNLELHVLTNFSTEENCLKVSQWCGLGYITEPGSDTVYPVHCKSHFSDDLSLTEMLQYICKTLNCPGIKNDIIQDIKNADKPKGSFCKYELLTCCALNDMPDEIKTEIEAVKSFFNDMPDEIKTEIEAVKSFFKATDKNAVSCFYAFNMPKLFEIYAACVLRTELKGSGCTVSTQERTPVFDPSKEAYYLNGDVIPDIVIKKGDVPVAVYDVKYKTGEKTKHTRNDRLQILAYALMKNVRVIGHIFPVKYSESKKLETIVGEVLFYQEFCCNGNKKPTKKEIEKHCAAINNQKGK